MRTCAAELLGVKLPISTLGRCRDVVASVSSTGGFDTQGAVAHSPTRLEAELAWVEEQAGRPHPFAMPAQGAPIGDPPARINRAAGPDSKARGPAAYFVGQGFIDAVGRPDELVNR